MVHNLNASGLTDSMLEYWLDPKQTSNLSHANLTQFSVLNSQAGESRRLRVKTPFKIPNVVQIGDEMIKIPKSTDIRKYEREYKFTPFLKIQQSTPSQFARLNSSKLWSNHGAWGTRIGTASTKGDYYKIGWKNRKAFPGNHTSGGLKKGTPQQS